MTVISVYLPKGLSAEDVASAVAAAKAAYPGDTTAVMRHLKTIPGMDMRLASQLGEPTPRLKTAGLLGQLRSESFLP